MPEARFYFNDDTKFWQSREAELRQQFMEAVADLEDAERTKNTLDSIDWLTAHLQVWLGIPEWMAREKATDYEGIKLLILTMPAPSGQEG